METAIYVVQTGDTLWTIANKFGVSLADLSTLNGITPLEILVTGASILIPHVPKMVESLGYFHIEDIKGLNDTLMQIGQIFTYGGVFQFAVTNEGSINIPSGADIDGVLDLLRSFRILPLMVITNLGETRFEPSIAGTVISDERAKSRLIDELLSLLRQYGFSGVNVDFENVDPEDREAFTQFVRELKLALESDHYLVTLTVPAKASDSPESPNKGGYDYKALGEWADIVLIMTYDWGYSGGPPMAVAPSDKVEEVIAYAVTQIPAVKILQGIPLYGYNWMLPYVEGKSPPATTVNLVDVYDIARRYKASIQYDPTAQSPFFHYTDEQNQEHVVWFEDSRSIQAKYAISRSYNLGGIGFWSPTNKPYGFPQNQVIINENFQVLKGAILI